VTEIFQSVRAFNSALQAVRSSAGATVRQHGVVVQAVTRGTATVVRVPSATVQIVSQSAVTRVKVAQSFVQAIRRGSLGAVVREALATVQVVYTTGIPESARARAWAFDFDGHTFYALDLGVSGTLVYDITTGQWSRFVTAGHDGHWDMKNGFHWRSGGMVVGGHAASPALQRLDEGSFFDEGWRPVEYEVRGALPVNGKDFRRQYSLRLVGSAGLTAGDITPVLKMQFSDDQGASWSAEHTVELKQDTRQRIEFRSLGAFTAPGRIFRLYSEGGIKFIAYVEADIGGENGSIPA